MATIPTKKISEITTLLSDLTKETLVAVAEDDGAGGYVTKKVDLRDIDDVQGYTDFASLPATGSTETLYLTTTENKLYFWDGAAYVDLFQAAHMTYDNTTGLTATKVQSAIDEVLAKKLDGTDFQQDSETTTGLTFGYKAGKFRNDNAIVSVSAGTVTLTDAATNYIEVDSAGMVSVNTTGFTSGQIPLFEVVTSGGVISSVTDKRSWLHLGGLRNVVEDTTPELGGELNAGLHSIGFTEKNNTSSAGAVTIDWKTSNKQKITLTENTTFSFTNPSQPCNLVLRIIQDATGGWTVTLPTIKTAGGTGLTFSTTAGAEDILMLYFDGANYIASLLQDIK